MEMAKDRHEPAVSAHNRQNLQIRKKESAERQTRQKGYYFRRQRMSTTIFRGFFVAKNIEVSIWCGSEKSIGNKTAIKHGDVIQLDLWLPFNRPKDDLGDDFEVNGPRIKSKQTSRHKGVFPISCGPRLSGAENPSPISILGRRDTREEYNHCCSFRLSCYYIEKIMNNLTFPSTDSQLCVHPKWEPWCNRPGRVCSHIMECPSQNGAATPISLIDFIHQDTDSVLYAP
ncbi:hypothetical protein RRG08_001752 [Elysia crispata]|uniref:Uncharacterized protein n=1 Tax=Elysia crispata TaxID=231223 RepID=A0AAE1AK45_9GAST|nr:hypothetical protein RRG08_001752 [Elysia crispata]